MADWRMDQAALAEHVQIEDSDSLEGESVQPDAGLLDDCAADDDFCRQNIIFMQEAGKIHTAMKGLPSHICSAVIGPTWPADIPTCSVSIETWFPGTSS